MNMGKTIFAFIIIFIFLLSSCKQENNEIITEYQADFLWLEGWLTYCDMVDDISDTSYFSNRISYKFYQDFTKNKETNILYQISKYAKKYPLKRLEYGYLNSNNKWEVRGVVAIFEYDSTTELRYVFCFDTTDYFKISSRDPNEYENIDAITKKMLEKELDKKHRYTLFKYLKKIKGEFIPMEDLLPNLKD